ncbi:putative dipeptidyl peptidase 3 [Daldinia childiae]|uniref:putative dipeptidyl peptidase 3 n=1 Tax=Daldinia childiae TaxID=326645 RepID=UPI0014456F98|nr:putative dipeptidyl peptidase 3 [Daldinia childiae]KAF3069081.1 putative dipeptidyl peptidase 3 [Daldinia childiae]
MAARVQIYKLGVKPLFDHLSEKEKLYSHYLSRAAWSGTRIILRQVSPESLGIFEFIMELYESCGGDWNQFSTDYGVAVKDLEAFLEFAATFLSNIGNYYGSGDQKFIPRVHPGTIEKLASRSPKLLDLYRNIEGSIMAMPPVTLGYPSTLAQSSYYPGDLMSKEEIALVSRHMDAHSILPENTRVRKTGETSFEVLQASIISTDQAKPLDITNSPASVSLVRGDHAEYLKNICENLAKAMEYAANDTQKKFLSQYIESFQTGNLETYRDSQRTWITDKGPKVENIFGFVEPYRDPAGIRAEFEGLVAIADADETKLLSKLVENSDKFIRRLPWATVENNGKGLFEKSLFEPPDFSSIHALAYCSSIIFPGINLPNYNDIRQDVGFKNVIIANRMIAESTAMQWPFIDDSEVEVFRKHKYPAYYWWVVLHELLGHGTGKMMIEEPTNKFNFDFNNPPINPLDGKPIRTWYKPGQTWTGQFGDLATTLDECRAELVGAYLMDDPELLALFGFTDESTIRSSDLTYNLYQQLGVDGLRALSNYNVDGMKWGQAHSRVRR